MFARCTAVATLVAGIVAWPVASAQPAPLPEPHIVNVDGRAVRVQVIGLDRRRPGTPVVVFEAGARNAIEIWSGVLPLAAQFAPIVAYDRAGLGRSDWDGVEPTPTHVVARLRRVLEAVGAPPPYVLVGFSWGGVLTRYHAGFHPNDVAGLVFVDPAPIVTHSLAERLVPFEAVGLGRAGFDSLWSTFAGMHRSTSEPVRAEFEVYRRLAASAVPDTALRPLPDIPTTLIVAGRYLPLPLELPYDPRAHFEADLENRIALLQDWIRGTSHGTLVVANHVTHVVPREDPELIAWSVQRVLSAASQPMPGEASRLETGITPGGLYYEVAGTGDPVVFIHAFSLDRRMWEPQRAAFERGYRVVRYDLRGHGRSAPPDGPYTGHEDLRELLDHLGIAQPTLVGLSAGAELAINFAIAHPERVGRVVLAGPGLGGFRLPPMPWLAPVFEAVAAGDAERAARLWASTPIMAVHVDTTAGHTVAALTLDNARLWTFRRTEQPLSPPAVDRLHEIRCPAVIIVGERDLPHVHEVAALLARGIAGAKLISIPGAGHISNLDDPEAFNSALSAALRH